MSVAHAPQHSPGRITVKLIPRAGKDEVLSWDFKGKILVAKVSAPPEDNKASIAMLKLVRKFFGKPVKLVGGRTARTKQVLVE